MKEVRSYRLMKYLWRGIWRRRKRSKWDRTICNEAPSAKAWTLHRSKANNHNERHQEQELQCWKCFWTPPCTAIPSATTTHIENLWRINWDNSRLYLTKHHTFHHYSWHSWLVSFFNYSYIWWEFILEGGTESKVRKQPIL